jgi:hypothetical protein
MDSLRRLCLLPALLLFCGCGGCSKTNTVLSPPLPVPRSSTPDLDPDYQKVISQLEKRGAQVEVLEEESNLKPQLMISFPKGQATDEDMDLIKQLHVSSLTLRDSKVTEPGLANLKDMKTLKVLLLEGTPVTDQGLEHLSKLTEFRTLSLGSQHISDAGMAHLKDLDSLNSFNVSSDQISDQGLAYLRPFKHLSSLVIGSAKITDAGLDNLQGLTLLGYLAVGSPGITDKGLEKIGRLTNLGEVNLSGCTNITDAGLAFVDNLPKLRNLYLENCTKISDGVVTQLKGIADPQTIDLKGTSVSGAGVKAIQAALPGVHVNR